MSFSPPQLITAAHRLENFDCGRDPLNQYLKKFALSNTAAGTARTYVVPSREDGSIIGYYSLAASAVEKVDAPERVAKGVANHPLPVVLLARLAVDRRFQGQGLGGGLLRDALQRALSAADVIGIRALLVHAKDEAAAQFYLKYGFSSSPTDPLHLMLLMKDLRRILQSE